MVSDSPVGAPETLWRTALHDFNNLLAGIQGVLDLSDPAEPLSPRNRLRLEATLEEGRNLVAMSRALALGRIPDTGQLPWTEWREGLLRRLEPLSVLFKCPVEVVLAEPGDGRSWPAPLLQDWALALSRQILPWVAPGILRIEAEVASGGWVLRWPDAPPIPPALLPEPPEDAARNLTSLWLRSMGERLGMILESRDGALVALLPKG
ncbi:MAG TPA: hypothetical protein VF804_01250 [Holophagaceae bacterium]